MKSIIKLALKCSKIVIESVRFSKKDGAIIISVRPYKNQSCRCPICRKKCRGYDTKTESKKWRSLDLLCAKCYLEYTPNRIKCPEHGVLTEIVPWARQNSGFTKPFEDWVACLAVQCTASAVARFARIEWHTVGSISNRVYEELEKQRGSSRFDNIKRIGIDETSYKKGHKYLTVVVDHDTSRLIWAKPGKSAAVLDDFFKQLTIKQRNNIEVVTADGAKWIKKVVKRRCKNAQYCMDPFHVISWMNDALDQVRRQEWNIAKSASDNLAPSKRDKAGRPKKEEVNEEYKKALALTNSIKNSRWPLLKGFDNLTNKDKVKIQQIKESAGKHLFKTWEYKEDLRKIFKCNDYADAEEMLDEWLRKTAYCKIKPVVEVEKKIRKRKNDILTSISLGLGNGRIEAINNKIKVTIKMGYGFRNIDNLISLLMLKCSDIQPSLPFISSDILSRNVA